MRERPTRSNLDVEHAQRDTPTEIVTEAQAKKQRLLNHQNSPLSALAHLPNRLRKARYELSIVRLLYLRPSSRDQKDVSLRP